MTDYKEKNNNLTSQTVAIEILSNKEKSVSPTSSAVLSAFQYFVQKLAKHHVWLLPLPPSSPLVFSPSYCLTLLLYRLRSSCTTNIRNSVNFTLWCLPKTLGPDSVIWPLESHSNPPHPPPPTCHQQRTLFLLHPCLDEAPSKHLEVTGYGVPSNKFRSCALCNLHYAQRSNEPKTRRHD